MLYSQYAVQAIKKYSSTNPQLAGTVSITEA